MNEFPAFQLDTADGKWIYYEKNGTPRTISASNLTIHYGDFEIINVGLQQEYELHLENVTTEVSMAKLLRYAKLPDGPLKGYAEHKVAEYFALAMENNLLTVNQKTPYIRSIVTPPILRTEGILNARYNPVGVYEELKNNMPPIRLFVNTPESFNGSSPLIHWGDWRIRIDRPVELIEDVKKLRKFAREYTLHCGVAFARLILRSDGRTGFLGA